MSKYSKLDRSQLNAARVEVDSAIDAVRPLLEAEFDLESRKAYREHVLQISDQVRRVEKAVRRLPSEYLVELASENLQLLKSALKYKSRHQANNMSEIVGESLSVLNHSLARIENGLAEDVLLVASLLNRVRSAQDKEAVHPVALFEPGFEGLDVGAKKGNYSEDEFKKHSIASRAQYHEELLRWLKGGAASSLEGINRVFDQCLSVATKTQNRQLWWIAQGYVDFLSINELDELEAHAFNFRRLDDVLRELSINAEVDFETADCVSLINSMLFYIGKAPLRTARMDGLVEQLNLYHYFPKSVEEQKRHISDSEVEEELHSRTIDIAPENSKTLNSGGDHIETLVDVEIEAAEPEGSHTTTDIKLEANIAHGGETITEDDLKKSPDSVSGDIEESNNIEQDEANKSAKKEEQSERLSLKPKKDDVDNSTVSSSESIERLKDEELASEQVASVFANMDEIDDLVEPSVATSKNLDADGEAEIEAFESSLDALNTTVENALPESKERKIKSEEIASLIPDDLTDLLQYEVNVEQFENNQMDAPKKAKSDKELLPDELTDLVEEGLLNMSNSFKNSVRKMRAERKRRDTKDTKK